MTKKYSIVEVKKDDCVFRMLDGFESAFYCKHDMRWFDDKKECVGCKYKDSGETKKQIVNKLKTAIDRQVSVPFSSADVANAICDFLGIKE